MSSCTRHFQKPLLRGVVLFLYAFLALSILLAFLWPARWLYALSNLWFGSCCYILLIVAAADLIRLVLKYLVKVPKEKLSSRKVFVTSGAFCILLILSLSVLGYIGARNIRTTHYEVTVDKSCQDLSSLRIVLAADLHLGYNMGNDQMKRMVEKINAADPDLVVIAGDFFDNDFDAVEDPETISATLRQIRSRYVLTPATATTTSRRRSWPASPSPRTKKRKATRGWTLSLQIPIFNLCGTKPC